MPASVALHSVWNLRLRRLSQFNDAKGSLASSAANWSSVDSKAWLKSVALLTLQSICDSVAQLCGGHRLTGGVVHLPLADHAHDLASGADDPGASK